MKKAHCELIDLFAPGGTKKSLRTVFSFFLLLEYFLDTGVHIFSTLVLRRFIGKFLQIFLKSASITSFFFWFQSYIIYIYSDYFPFLKNERFNKCSLPPKRRFRMTNAGRARRRHQYRSCDL